MLLLWNISGHSINLNLTTLEKKFPQAAMVISRFSFIKVWSHFSLRKLWLFGKLKGIWLACLYFLIFPNHFASFTTFCHRENDLGILNGFTLLQQMSKMRYIGFNNYFRGHERTSFSHVKACHQHPKNCFLFFSTAIFHKI